MASNTDETIKLVIRTANNKHADFELELPPSATIYELKRKITVNHPTKPTPRDQRLIFSGKLLDDASALNQVFVKATTGSTPMVHLVLDSDKTATSPKPPQQSTPRPSEQPVPCEKPTPSTHSSSYEQYSEQLNKYQQQLYQFVADPHGSPPVPSYETQAYLQYCYTHYQMYQNLLAYQRTTAPPSVPVNLAPAGEAPSGAVPPAAAAAAAQPAAGNNNNEVEQENDLLGVLNMLVELFVLCSIIYFYSTLSRFILVFVFFILLYLHCRGYLSLQRRRPVPPARPAPVVPEQQAAENDAEDDADADPPANEVPNQNDGQRPRAAPSAQAPDADGNVQISATRLLVTAVSTFFSSLIPERPQRA